MNHTDERDAYEHIVREMKGLKAEWLAKYYNGDYHNNEVQFGWQVFQKTLLAVIERAPHA